MTSNSRYVVIMAGGSGKRLGPVSSKQKPKQFHALVSDKTMLQETLVRVSPIARRDQIYVSTTLDYVDIVRAQLVDFPTDRIIVEPCARDTMPAIAYVSQMIHDLDPEAIIITTPSDHAIKYVHDFTNAVQTAFDVVEQYPDRIGLLGIEPTGPSTALGYIRRGKRLSGFSGKGDIFEVSQFREKPDGETAKKYHEDGEHYWNGGYFVFKAKTLLDLVAKHAPQITNVFEEMRAVSGEIEREVLFRSLDKVPIDKAILEKISESERFVVATDPGWSDVGTWNTLHEYSPKDGNGNVCRGEVFPENSFDNLIFATSKKIVTYGVRNLVIIEVDGLVTIFGRDTSDGIKDIIHLL